MLLTLKKLPLLALISAQAFASSHVDPAASAHESAKSVREYRAANKDLIESIEQDIGAFQEYQNKNYDFFISEAEKVKEDAESFLADNRDENIFKHGTIVGGISNEAIAKEELKRRQYLKLEQEDQLYIFVSRSMPINLVRSYALDAAYSGAILVMRGLDKNERLQDFFSSDYMFSVKPEGMGAMFQIDPRLFDAFQITSVPTIVFTEAQLNRICTSPQDTNTKCQPVADDSYFKISGNVTLKYALEQFKEHGASGGAERFLETLKHGYATGEPENPSLMAELDADVYLQEMKKLYASLNITNSQQGTHLIKTELIETAFGPVEAPVGKAGLLKNAGGLESIFRGIK